jgi:hypothetical protein
MMVGVNSSMIFLIYYKNFCKYLRVPPAQKKNHTHKMVNSPPLARTPTMMVSSCLQLENSTHWRVQVLTRSQDIELALGRYYKNLRM